MKISRLALAGVAPLAGALSYNQNVVGSIPCPDAYGRQPVNASLLCRYSSPSLSKSNEKMSSDEDEKIEAVFFFSQ